jgi:tRNA A37 threonylcarbamoyladenosine biosynthesis protein TsaE
LKFKNFYHVDLYRLEGDLDREVLNLGLPYIWSEPESIMVIEWAEKIRALVPSGATWITFEDMGESKRRLLVK